MPLDPSLLEVLPREMLAQIVQKLSVTELQELLHTHPPLGEKLEGVVRVFHNATERSTDPVTNQLVRGFQRFTTREPLDQGTPAPFTIVIVTDLPNFPWTHFREKFLQSPHKKIVYFSEPVPGVWGVKGRSVFRNGQTMTLNKVISFMDDENTTLISPTIALHLKHTIISNVEINTVSGSFKSLVLEGVLIMGKLDPFRNAVIDWLKLTQVPQMTLDNLPLNNVRTLGLHARGEDPTIRLYEDVFYADRLCGLRSTRLEKAHITGIVKFEDWSTPALHHLKVSFGDYSDFGLTNPSFKKMVMPLLTTFEVIEAETEHVEEDLIVEPHCIRRTTQSSGPPLKIAKFNSNTQKKWTDEYGNYLKSVKCHGVTFTNADAPMLAQLEYLDVTTQSREQQISVFHASFNKLKSLIWRVIDGPEIGSIPIMKPVCVHVEELTVYVSQKVRVHYDFLSISRSFPNLKRLTLTNCYYNKKLIIQRDGRNEVKLPKLESLSLSEYPEEVLDVFSSLFVPRLKDLSIDIQKDVLSKRANVDFRFQSSSSLETLDIQMKESSLEGFADLRRTIHINSHPRLRVLKVAHYNTVRITDCFALNEIVINDGKAPLELLQADRLPECHSLSYPISGVSHGGHYKHYQAIPLADRDRINEVERYKQWIDGKCVRHIVAVPLRSMYYNKRTAASASPAVATPPHVMRQQQSPPVAQQQLYPQPPQVESNGWGSSPAPQPATGRAYAWGGTPAPPVQQPQPTAQVSYAWGSSAPSSQDQIAPQNGGGYGTTPSNGTAANNGYTAPPTSPPPEEMNHAPMVLEIKKSSSPTPSSPAPHIPTFNQGQPLLRDEDIQSLINLQIPGLAPPAPQQTTTEPEPLPQNAPPPPPPQSTVPTPNTPATSFNELKLPTGPRIVMKRMAEAASQKHYDGHDIYIPERRS